MHQPIKTFPTKFWLKTRLGIPETEITGEHQKVYLNALECIRLLIQSPYERVLQDSDTGGWINSEGNLYFRMINTYIPHHMLYRYN